MWCAKIAVILPSRGLIFSKTAEEVLANVKDIPHRFFFSHRKPIPDCFEIPVNEALKDESITHIWLVEDDMILPPHVLKDMLAKDLAVVTANYPTTANKDAAVLSIKGRIVYGGTGCTLVKREVFDELTPPYFRTDIVWKPKNLGDCIRFTAKKRTKNTGYGLHDVNFFMNLYKLDIPVHKLDYTLGQRKLKALGKSGSNNGQHDIEEWTKVKKDRFFTLKKHLPPPEETALVEVITPSGALLCKPDHAKRLIKAGKATKAPKRAVVIDDGGLL